MVDVVKDQARLNEAAPELLQACRSYMTCIRRSEDPMSIMGQIVRAMAKAGVGPDGRELPSAR